MRFTFHALLSAHYCQGRMPGQCLPTLYSIYHSNSLDPGHCCNCYRANNGKHRQVCPSFFLVFIYCTRNFPHKNAASLQRSVLVCDLLFTFFSLMEALEKGLSYFLYWCMLHKLIKFGNLHTNGRLFYQVKFLFFWNPPISLFIDANNKDMLSSSTHFF
jgi:hypothetical protein